jgi:epoxyqueuosine reductase QueG
MSRGVEWETECTIGEVVDRACDLGAAVAGVAPVERFEQAEGSYLPSGYGPGRLLPGARSVVVVAVRLLDGVLASNLQPLDTTFAYGDFGYVRLNRVLGDITYALAAWLESLGWSSLPLGACGTARIDRAAYEAGRTVGPLSGIFSLKRAAVLAGVGRRSRSGLVATERYGTRVRLGAVVTAAPLEGSPVLAGNACPDGCRLCVSACPMGAIADDGVVNHVKCYSDMGRRGRDEAESLDEMSRAHAAQGVREGYLPYDHAAIDGFGNRMCRVVCMAVCPLWQFDLRQGGSTA